MISSVHHLKRLPTSSCGTAGLAITAVSGSVKPSLPSLRMVNAAADEIYKRWLPHIGEAGAREQSDAFARRCAHPVEHFVLTGNELDEVLEVVTNAMNAQP